MNEPKKSTVICSSGVRKDTGDYIIVVENKHGSDTATINVVVLGMFCAMILMIVIAAVVLGMFCAMILMIVIAAVVLGMFYVMILMIVIAATIML